MLSGFRVADAGDQRWLLHDAAAGPVRLGETGQRPVTEVGPGAASGPEDLLHAATHRRRSCGAGRRLRQRLPDSPHGFQRQRRRRTQQRFDQRRPRRRRSPPFDGPRGADGDRHRVRAAVCRSRRRARRRGDGGRQADEAGRGPSGQRRRHGAHSARRPEQRRRRVVDVEGRPQRRSHEVRRVGGADGARRHDRTAAAVRRPRQLVVRIPPGRPFTLPARKQLCIEQTWHKRFPSDAQSQGVLVLLPDIRRWTSVDEIDDAYNRCRTT